jgi:hypothetical protein
VNRHPRHLDAHVVPVQRRDGHERLLESARQLATGERVVREHVRAIMARGRTAEAPLVNRYRDTQGRLGPTLQDGLALMYDRVEGMVMRHGEAASVDAYYRRLTDELARTTLTAGLVMLVLDLDKLSPALLGEVNRAIQTSGYLAEHADRLGAPGAE